MCKLNVEQLNSRSPSVGIFRGGGQIIEANLLGLGDAINLEYGNTEGSNAYDFGYTLPLHPLTMTNEQHSISLI